MTIIIIIIIIIKVEEIIRKFEELRDKKSLIMICRCMIELHVVGVMNFLVYSIILNTNSLYVKYRGFNPFPNDKF